MEPPALASLLRNFSILGHQHGCLIAVDECTKIPTIMNLCTYETYNFPSYPHNLTRSLLTSPPNSEDSMLILYRGNYHTGNISYCRVGDRSGWQLFCLPYPIWSAALHDNMLYFLSDECRLMVVDMGQAGSLNLVRVIERPCLSLTIASVLTVFEDELVMIPEFQVSGRRIRVHRLELSKGGEGKWRAEGLGRGHSLFLSNDVNTSGYVWSGRMKEAEEQGVRHTKLGSSLRHDKEDATFKCIEGKAVWVPPSNLEQWGFKNMLI